MNENDLNQNFQRIKEENEVLKKLLYRNKNQHGRTKFHSYLKRISQLLSLITEQSNSIITLNLQFENTIKALNKPNSQVIKDSLTNYVNFIRITSLFLELSLKCIDPVIIAQAEISEVFFLSLFSVYLALVSRVFMISSKVVIHHYKHLNILQSLLQNCASLFTKHRDNITNIIIQHSLSDDSINFINTLESSPDLISKNNNNKTRHQKHHGKSHNESVIRSSSKIEDVGESIIQSKNKKLIETIINKKIEYDSDSDNDNDNDNEVNITNTQIIDHSNIYSNSTSNDNNQIDEVEDSQELQFDMLQSNSAITPKKPLNESILTPLVKNSQSLVTEIPIPKSNLSQILSTPLIINNTSHSKETEKKSITTKRKQNELIEEKEKSDNNSNNGNNSTMKKKMKKKSNKLSEIDDIFGDFM